MKYKVIFIGNSIVAGYPWGKGKSFVGILRRILKGDDSLIFKQPAFAKNAGFEIINKGVNGDTTAGIVSRINSDALVHNPDVVFFMTGTNDFIYREATPEEAFAHLEILCELTMRAGALPVYMTPLSVDSGKAEYMWMAGCGISYDAVNRDIDCLSEMIRKSGRQFVDTNSLFRNFCVEIGDPELTYLDGLHPLPSGHEFIAGEVLKFIEANIAELGLK